MSAAEVAVVLDRRIKLWWPGDSAWYTGGIIRYAKKSGKHLVKYDDGDKKWHNLWHPEEKWEYLADGTPHLADEMASHDASTSKGRGRPKGGPEKCADCCKKRKTATFCSACPTCIAAQPATSTAMPPPLPVAGDGVLPDVGGGKRKIVPTMVKVGNQFVKRQNMYR